MTVIRIVFHFLIIFAMTSLSCLSYSKEIAALPSLNDSSLSVEAVASGLYQPTNIDFIDENNILVLEKDGHVRHVLNGQLMDESILDLMVDSINERGLLGIAIVNENIVKKDGETSDKKEDTPNSHLNDIEVFLYYTEFIKDKKEEQLRNKIYKYNWNGHSLVSPTLILDLPALPGPNHNGGEIILDSVGNLYAIIGDLNHHGILQNVLDDKEPDNTSVILKVNSSDGSASTDNPFINDTNSILHKYYAYGIRNSFGMDIDPLTGNLWDTENGYEEYDEINVVKPGFNSGWQDVMGPLQSIDGESNFNEENNPKPNLANFSGSYYSDPAISWKYPIGITAIEFFESSLLGDRYKNNIFVGDYKNGNLYFFTINSSRNGIEFPESKSDMNKINQSQPANKNPPSPVIDIEDESLSAIFGDNFNGITDIKTGPDGYLYVLSFGDGMLYRILPSKDLMHSTLLIDEKHQQWGGINGSLGAPISNVSITSDKLGYYRLYEDGAIYWKQGGVPHVTHGGIYQKWNDQNREKGTLGYPLTDETPTNSGIGYFNLFEHGAIYWTPSTGPHSISGDIYERWKTLGSEEGELGYPTSDIQQVQKNGETTATSYFQGGSIQLIPHNSTIKVTYDMYP